MSCGLAIFVKTPALSPVKTRLWPALGQRTAETLYLMSAEAVASVAEQARQPGGIEPCWAVAEAAALGSDAWADLPHLPQGDGGLGERMSAVYAALLDRHEAAVLIGADAPQLTSSDLHSAAQWLASAERRLVIGRAADGGFWLVGGNFPIRHDVWTSVTYSTPDAAAELVEAVGTGPRWAELQMLQDIDTATDIAPVANALTQLANPTASQARLAQWLAQLDADRVSTSAPNTASPNLQTAL